jgi:protein MpaA
MRGETDVRAVQKRALISAITVAALVIAVLLLLGWRGYLWSTGTTGTTTTSSSTATSPLARQTIGASVQGRPIELFSLGSGSKRVLIIGGIHGDETGGEIARELLSYLEKHADALPEGMSLRVIPDANPDGETAGTRGNANNVDINRNFPSANWSGELNTGDRPTAGLSGGARPGSEPETRALLACLADGYDLVIALHSSGGIIDYDGAQGLPVAEHMSAICGLPVRHLDYQEQVTGSLGTYVPERYQVPVITVELEETVLTPKLRTALLTALDPI